MKPDGADENHADYGRNCENFRRDEDEKMSSLLGVGLDGTDGEVRLTRGPDFALVGGSQQTHEIMQETVCKVNEKLGKRGKTLQDTTRHEFYDVLQDVVESLNHPQD